MSNLQTKIESLLFVATKPLTVKRLAEMTKSDVSQVEEILKELSAKWNDGQHGIQLLRHGSSVELVTNAAASKLVTEYLKEEQAGELTRPALETLTIIAYRGPISKIQLDTIRGVNCALILRNLMIKGLIEAIPHTDRLQTSYQVTDDFVKFLGLTSLEQLPNYEQLHVEETLNTLLNPAPTLAVTEETNHSPTT